MTAPPRPLAGLTFSLVGPGKVGGTLATRLAARGARCAAVAGRPSSRATADLAPRLQATAVELAALDSGGEELLLLALPEGALAAAAELLARRSQARVALHVSGALGASALAPLASAGVATGTFHPLRAFPRAELDQGAEPLACFFALDGAPSAVELGRRLAAALGGTAEVVPESRRLLYHLAATLFAGGVATVVAAAREIVERGGLPAASAAGYADLARGALEAALAAERPARAITGPAARGDREIVVAELRELARAAPEVAPLVVALARESLRQQARLGPLSASQASLDEALSRADLLDLPKVRVLTSDRPDTG